MSAALSAKAFVANWSQIRLKETAASQSHFNDVCALIGHEPPHIADPKGSFFTFEASTEKAGGGRGRADVWYKGRFIWEYKGVHADLDKAYQQLQLYRESLGNPYLLITSDLQRIIIHTNFPNTVKEVHEITLERIASGDGVALLRRAFTEPKSFQPSRTQEVATKATAETFVDIVNTLQKWGDGQGQPHDPEQVAHFVIRLLFCMFAEDLNLLPNHVFTRTVEQQGRHFNRFVQTLRQLFTTMRDGGPFGVDYIPYFDGGLFDDNFVPELPSDIVDKMLKAARQDWSSIDPSIFGTLFERVIDQDKRAQLGAHYTSKEDIMLIVEPVLLKPLRDKWQTVKHEARQCLRRSGEAEKAQCHAALHAFSEEITAVRVLDPACGSGNFLYVALRQLLDLQKEVIAFAGRNGLPEIPLTVSPAQLFGIEINPYAHELAQITVWIGYLQWRQENGFADFEEPILRPLQNIERKDAILAYDEDGRAIEPAWPTADVIIGNPPFLGGNKIRQELGDKIVESLFQLYNGRVPAFADLVCYWFEKARAQIENQQTQRAGLIATNSIRGGANREVLKRIKESGDIFMAWSDNPWILDGAAVRVSLVGFDDKSLTRKILNGQSVVEINSDLTASVDISKAKKLDENADICFMGPSPKGPFDISENVARRMLQSENTSGYSNSDVVRPVFSATDIVRSNRNLWTVDFGLMDEETAKRYEVPYEYIKREVYPIRSQNRRAAYAKYWWLYAENRPGMRKALEGLKKKIVTPAVAKHRLFVFVNSSTLCNQGCLVFARDDDYFFGVLHSHLHEIWALRMGTSLEDRPRYTPTTTFETFPFPWPPGTEPAEADNPRVFAIAEAARQLVRFRQSWLNPPPEDIDTIIPTRIIKKLTLTNLYNALTLYRTAYKGKIRDRSQWHKEVKGIITLDQIEELDYIHHTLDNAVLDAYGWPHTLTDEQILEHLLTLNLERAAKEA